MISLPGEGEGYYLVIYIAIYSSEYALSKYRAYSDHILKKLEIKTTKQCEALRRLLKESKLGVILLDYGYRSKCCYAPIRVGWKNLKNTTSRVQIWICCKCKRRDVDLVEYNKDGYPESTTPIFAEPEDAS